MELIQGRNNMSSGRAKVSFLGTILRPWLLSRSSMRAWKLSKSSCFIFLVTLESYSTTSIGEIFLSSATLVIIFFPRSLVGTRGVRGFFRDCDGVFLWEISGIFYYGVNFSSSPLENISSLVIPSEIYVDLFSSSNSPPFMVDRLALSKNYF